MISIHPISNLYRYWSFNGLKDVLTNRKLSFVNPIFWEDSLDKIHLETDFKNLGFEQPIIYCLCFNASVANEKTHWKIYNTKDKLLVRSSFKTDVLLKLVEDFANKNKFGVHILAVDYSLSEKDIATLHLRKHKYHDKYFDNFSLNKYLELLCLKPNVYEHEHEVRIFLVPKSKKKHPYKTIDISIQDEYFEQLFDELTIFIREYNSDNDKLKSSILLDLQSFLRNMKKEELTKLYPYIETNIYDAKEYRKIKKI